MNSVKQRISRVVTACILLVVLFPLSQISAQTTPAPIGNGFRISPVRSEFTIQKGQSKTFTITLENPSAAALTARPIVNDFVASEDESGEPRLILDPDTVLPRNDFKRLVSPLEDVVIPANQKKDITVTLSVPTYVDAGGYYGAIRFVPVLPDEDGRNVALTASIGSIVLVQVPGEIRQQLTLLQLSAAQKQSSRGFLIGGDVSVLTRLKNTGNIHVKPFGKVQIKNMFGKVVHEYEFNNTDPRGNVLPDSIRKFIDPISNKKWLGRYTISINLSYSDGGDIITAKSAFWYFPVPVFYTLLALLLALAIGVNFLVYRHRRKRKVHHRK